MSEGEFKDQLDQALSVAIAGDADLDELDDALEDAQERVEEIKMVRGQA